MPRVAGAGGVVLELIVAPTITTSLLRPLLGIDRTAVGSIEFVAPRQHPFGGVIRRPGGRCVVEKSEQQRREIKATYRNRQWHPSVRLRLGGCSRKHKSNRSYYSLLSASMGSTAAARRAGIYIASTATVISKAAMPTKVVGSLALTPYTKLTNSLPAPNATAQPSITPGTTSQRPCPSMSCTTLPF